MPYHAKSALHLKPTHELVSNRMLYTLGVAATTVGVPLYLISLGMPDSQIGIFIGLSALLIAVMSLFMPPLLEKFNQLRLLIISSILTGLSYVFFGYTKSIIMATVLIFVTNLCITVSVNSLSILFKDSTRNKQEFTRDTGLMGSLVNLSWFIGPLLGGLTLNYAGVNGLFILSGSLCIISAAYLMIMPIKTVIKKRERLDVSVKENLRFYLSRLNLKIAYIQRMGITVWWGFIWTFIPIFMAREGYSVASIGLFISLTQLPLFLLEFKTVNIISKVGYRNVFVGSYAILAAICIYCFFTDNFAFAMIALSVGSISLSFIEPISELFFFDQVTKIEEEKTYPIYGTSSMIGSTLARLGVGIGLAILSDRAAFLVVAVFMALIAFNATKIRTSNNS